MIHEPITTEIEYCRERIERLTERLDDWNDTWTDADEDEWNFLQEEIVRLENKIKPQS